MKTRRERKKKQKNLYYKMSCKPKYGPRTVVWRVYLTIFYILPKQRIELLGK